MNSSIRSIQILINLLKQSNVKDVVLSPGGSDIPLIHAIETDSWFTCYSVIDERSAAYFALGVAQEKNRIVACVCTSGTAVCNYLPGITEAYYQNVPVLAITADKNPYFQGQLETQKIDQTTIFTGVVKKSVNLPIISNKDDEWLCNRLVNEALISLTHHGKGPVQINIPIVGRTDLFDNKELPKERFIKLIESSKIKESLETIQSKIIKAKRILIVVGQNVEFTDYSIKMLETFYSRCNCAISIEHLSNLQCAGCINTYPVTETCSTESLNKLVPELVISFGNNLSAYNLKPFLRRNYKQIDNWLVSESGIVRDAYKSLTTIFECSVPEFLENMIQIIPENQLNNNSYYNDWKEALEKIQIPEFNFSNLYVASKLSSIIPKDSLLHLAILNSTRIMQFFKLEKNVKTYSNVGALGIDGCFSTFVGQSVSTDKLAYLLIGDLSFFYDMNAASLKNLGPNVRVILINNCGGSEFHFFIGKEKISTINDNICAKHHNVAAGWIISLGYDYYSASSKEELDDVIEKFGKKSDKPMFLEVITEMEDDANITRNFYKSNIEERNSTKAKKMIRSIISEKKIEKVKKIIKAIQE